TVRVITPYGSLTVDQILGRQGEMLADDARATIRGEPLPEQDPLRLLAARSLPPLVCAISP
ncbi:MAG TPA: hypothetical protein VNC63_09030, partial [Propionibacteriaceae bacterium]|nr:hypothetical protein [Propionibacteriaceae bacterium]